MVTKPKKPVVPAPDIDLTDMSRLRVIAHLQANAPSEMAREIASALQSKQAREAARLLLGSGATVDEGARIVVDALKEANKPTPGRTARQSKLYRTAGS